MAASFAVYQSRRQTVILGHSAMHEPPPSFEPVIRSPRQPPARLRMQLLLFVVTCLTTFAAGAVGWEPLLLGVDPGIAERIATQWPGSPVLPCIHRAPENYPGSPRLLLIS
jgi:hypothetical protein